MVVGRRAWSSRRPFRPHSGRVIARSVEARANWSESALAIERDPRDGVIARRSVRRRPSSIPIEKEIAAIEARARDRCRCCASRRQADRRVTSMCSPRATGGVRQELVVPGTRRRSSIRSQRCGRRAAGSPVELAEVARPIGGIPLTARVHVNRVWERFFGRGLVETAEDFGTQGTPPDRPGVAGPSGRSASWRLGMESQGVVPGDRHQCDVSSGFRGSPRQATRIGPAQSRIWREAGRFRLEAEAIRDSALEASGLRSDRMFGPPVFPPQPDGVWEIVYSGDRWTTAMDEDRHRRGLCTPSGVGRPRIPRWSPSMRGVGRRAPCVGSGRTRRCRHW